MTDTQSALIKVMDNVETHAALVQAEIDKRCEFIRRSMGQRVRRMFHVKQQEAACAT